MYDSPRCAPPGQELEERRLRSGGRIAQRVLDGGRTLRTRRPGKRGKGGLALEHDEEVDRVPRVRIVDALPVGATNKLDKRPLRAECWETTDQLFWRPPRHEAYEPFTPADADTLRAEFQANGRANLLA